MTFVTTMTVKSGDRAVLDDVVDNIKRLVSRKGAEMKGPHPSPPEDLRVPLYKRLAEADGTYDPWDYTVYTRTIEIVGHDAVARTVATREIPESVQVEVEVERIRSVGSRS